MEYQQSYEWRCPAFCLFELMEKPKANTIPSKQFQNPFFMPLNRNLADNNETGVARAEIVELKIVGLVVRKYEEFLA